MLGKERTPENRENRDSPYFSLPATGTGIAGFDLRGCAEIMLDEVARHVAGPTTLTDVYFVLFDQAAADVFKSVYERTFA